MPGLTIIVAAPDHLRFHAALSVAAANAALGGRTRLFLQGPAAALLDGRPAPEDESKTRHGIPTQAQLLAEAHALGVEMIVCQSGMALVGLRADALPQGAVTGGLIELLSTRDGDALLFA